MFVRIGCSTKYVIGKTPSYPIKVPLIDQYGVNFDAPGDIYDKGASLIHTIGLLWMMMKILSSPAGYGLRNIIIQPLHLRK